MRVFAKVILKLKKSNLQNDKLAFLTTRIL